MPRRATVEPVRARLTGFLLAGLRLVDEERRRGLRDEADRDVVFFRDREGEDVRVAMR